MVDFLSVPKLLNCFPSSMPLLWLAHKRGFNYQTNNGLVRPEIPKGSKLCSKQAGRTFYVHGTYI